VARQVLGEDALIGRSCHALDDVEFCAEANYVTISPLWPTSSKEGHPGIFSQLQPVSALSPVVFGLGGVQKENLSKTLALGFYGIAARSLVWSSEEPDAVAAEILAKLSSFALP